MAVTDTASRLAPYLERLLEDDAAREELRRGADKLRDAYDRSQKRRVKPTQDKKLRSQLQSAAHSLGDGASSLLAGPQKPKRRGRLLIGVLALAAIGAGVALSLNDELRSSLLGKDTPPAPGADGTHS